MDIGTWELLSYIVTTIGFPSAILVFLYEQKKERDNEEDGRQPAYGVLNTRVTWSAPDEAWSVSAYALNMTDEYYFYGKLSLLANSGREQGNPAPPREVGVSLRYNF